MKCLKNILNNFEFMTKNHPQKDYFSLDGFSFGGLLEYILQHALAKFQPATTCNSQNTSQNTQKYQKLHIVLSKPVALYVCLCLVTILNVKTFDSFSWKSLGLDIQKEALFFAPSKMTLLFLGRLLTLWYYH